ncbi:MAG: hypothetical protein FJ037_01450 [Chloroflexi bacterium]|nr:hypothetical protein [Chloroflexota bacterium]
MNAELILLRVLHVLPGVLWVGGALLMAWVIEPALRADGPAVQGPAMRAVGKKLSMVLTAAASVSILMGLALVVRTPGRDGADLFVTSWGWSIGLGTVAAVASAGIGSMAGGVLRRMDAVAAQISGAPTPAQAAEMARLQAGLRRNSRIGSILGVLAVVLMVSARYV